MTRADILEDAKRIVTKDRQATHGKAEDSFRFIKNLWNSYLENKTNIKDILNSVDVALMMDLLKTARCQSNPKHMDNWIDKCGYSACGGEEASTVKLKASITNTPLDPTDIL